MYYMLYVVLMIFVEKKLKKWGVELPRFKDDAGVNNYGMLVDDNSKTRDSIDNGVNVARVFKLLIFDCQLYCLHYNLCAIL